MNSTQTTTSTTPKWFLPTAVAALLWNLIGCAAYLADVMLSGEDIAAMDAALQAIYESRPLWVVAGTAIAVWAGAAGSIGLIMRKRWAMPVLVASLAGIVIQDIGIFVATEAAATAGPSVFALQGGVLLIGIGLVFLSRRAIAEGWIA